MGIDVMSKEIVLNEKYFFRAKTLLNCHLKNIAISVLSVLRYCKMMLCWMFLNTDPINAVFHFQFVQVFSIILLPVTLSLPLEMISK